MNTLETVYLPDTLFRWKPYAAFAKRLVDTFDIAGTPYEILKGTHDIWAKDFMPIETMPNQFVQFLYAPDYLMKFSTYERRRTNGAVFIRNISPQGKVIMSNIILDGGNVVMNDKYAIVSDKIWSENAKIPPFDLIDELEDILGRMIILIPRFKDDEIGHADGMVRFLPDGSLLLNAYTGSDAKNGDIVRDMLEAYGFKTHTLCYNPYGNRTRLDATGMYINYLQVGNNVFVPQFEGSFTDTDIEAQLTLSTHFRGCNIFPVPCYAIAKKGGLLNCISWTRKVAVPNTRPDGRSDGSENIPSSDHNSTVLYSKKP